MCVGDVRVGNEPDPRIVEPTDGLVRITRTCICGRDLWPHHEAKPTQPGRPRGHEAIRVMEAVGAGVRKVKQGDFVIMPFARLLSRGLANRVCSRRVLWLQP